jgi:hypothetical protein
MVFHAPPCRGAMSPQYFVLVKLIVTKHIIVYSLGFRRGQSCLFAEIPQASGVGAEELERKARSPRASGDAPKFISKSAI